MSKLVVRNRQRQYLFNMPLLRRIARRLADEQFQERPYEIEIHLLSARAMTRLNEEFLRHSGSTDVITFSYSTPAKQDQPLLGEILICVEEAIRQASQFGVAWQKEIVRYMAHGMLHLNGYDDSTREQRRQMKKEENRLVRRFSERFPLRELSRKLKVAP
jgi:cytidine deaminase